MSEVERKLSEYRAKRNSKSTSSGSFWKFLFTKESSKVANQEAKEKLLSENYTHEKHNHSDTVDSPCDEVDSHSISSDTEDLSIDCCTYTELIFYSLCFILWVIIWGIFIKIQFGTVYFITSGLIGLYFNTRTGPKKKGEISAYSVFNKDCKSIDGTLKAEQFEREIRYGSGSMH